MIHVRKAQERGATKIEWLDSRHTFSFADYYDPDFSGFRALRVLNDDRVAPAGGFPTHPHRDMEILTWVLEGSLEHKDSMGTGSVIRPGDAQKMSAGTGVFHSEFNPSKTEAVHFLQIWLLPRRRGLKPSYAQQSFGAEARRGKLCLIASGDARDGSIPLHQDVSVYATLLEKGERVSHTSTRDRFRWVQVASGSVAVNGVELGEGDGAATVEEPQAILEAEKGSEVLLFDLG
jgi:quercetin 2,3-dioxygenase